jgi:hypothetical protein
LVLFTVADGIGRGRESIAAAVKQTVERARALAATPP